MARRSFSRGLTLLAVAWIRSIQCTTLAFPFPHTPAPYTSCPNQDPDQVQSSFKVALGVQTAYGAEAVWAVTKQPAQATLSDLLAIQTLLLRKLGRRSDLAPARMKTWDPRPVVPKTLNPRPVKPNPQPSTSTPSPYTLNPNSFSLFQFQGVLKTWAQRSWPG